MNTEEKISQEFGGNKEYNDVFKTIKTIDTISNKENKNWSIEDLENFLLSSFKKAGQKALKDNNGVIYTTLSGGLDSTLSLALLRESLGSEVKIITFTMGGDKKHPDIKCGRLAAKEFKTEHHEFIPTPDEINIGLEDFKKERPDENLEEAVSKGNFDVYLLYKYISSFEPKTVIVHDGIDEQMGGYFLHRKEQLKEGERKENFRSFWQKLKPEHLDGLIKSNRSRINFLFPYLDKKLVSFIAEIPVEDRVIKEIGKVPLRKIARKLGVPQEIINRPKIGAIDMTVTFFSQPL
ncbi:MAG: asparagine synthase-related protein [Candidatus Shapirobacteria bacterium]|nr:asparagine synthase-related protein [Candidatus Shapirobacteria bacterium]